MFQRFQLFDHKMFAKVYILFLRLPRIELLQYRTYTTIFVSLILFNYLHAIVIGHGFIEPSQAATSIIQDFR